MLKITLNHGVRADIDSSLIGLIFNYLRKIVFNFLEIPCEFLWFATMTLLNMYSSYIFKGFQIISYLSIYEVPETRDKMLKILPIIHMRRMSKLDTGWWIYLFKAVGQYFWVWRGHQEVILSLKNVGTKMAL